jgi:ABC-type transport system involved in multi-copper enzyme maturation permease subunit
MTAVETPVATPPAPQPAGRAGFRLETVSEWTKLRSIRSTWICLAIIVVLSIGLSALVCFAQAKHWTVACGDRLTFDPVSASQIGALLSQFVVGVLGALVITSEYATGLIRTTFATVPRRTTVLGAKALVVSVVILVVSEITIFISFLVGQSVLTAMGGKVYPSAAAFEAKVAPFVGRHLSSCPTIPMSRLPIPVANFSTPGALRALILGGIYLTILTLVAVGFGVILRHTAGTISLFVGVLLILPLLIQLLPSNWSGPIAKYLPNGLGQAMTSPNGLNYDGNPLMSPWTALVILVIYVVVVLGVGATLLNRRDA